MVSERTRPRPDENVRRWLRTHRVSETYLSVITLAELEQGILRLGETRRGGDLQSFLVNVERQFQGRILPVDQRVARVWASLTARTLREGKVLGYADSLIAATAQTHNLTVVTRNTSDFTAAEIALVNPWDE